MAKIDEQLNADKAKAFTARIEKFEKEIEAEELHDGGKYDWNVARVGEVGSDSWNMNMQEVELELDKKLAQHAKSTNFKELQRIKQLAGIAKPHVEALALKHAKRKSKNP